MNKQDFVQLLVSHDWYYERSEDSNAYKNGARQRRAIIKAKTEVFFKGASTSEYMRQSGYFMLDEV